MKKHQNLCRRKTFFDATLLKHEYEQYEQIEPYPSSTATCVSIMFSVLTSITDLWINSIGYFKLGLLLYTIGTRASPCNLYILYSSTCSDVVFLKYIGCFRFTFYWWNLTNILWRVSAWGKEVVCSFPNSRIRSTIIACFRSALSFFIEPTVAYIVLQIDEVLKAALVVQCLICSPQERKVGCLNHGWVITITC